MYQKRNNIALLVALLLLTLLSACATLPTQKQLSEEPLTSKQQAIVWMDTYNMQYMDTMFIMTSPSSTETQKEIGRKKKEILLIVWPKLKDYVRIVELETEIFNQMNQLKMLTGDQ